ncbi:exported protein of unknown function [Candidatus Filomicrobium marinum]|uniref:Disulfide bond formation protein B n=1 Tax=Candidatus Filomicrobium marinum TaxID=1608628 RepID=A0A0D6JCA9_9HYPH|nr:hypothetical protein [Candidatus Filomicrobium marinum]CFX04991.1 exported protein of unknown function [Candidatus Filomicrobium marinum]CPR16160.1 exported protein of unknown function [Candidatus Filomicrobium marinum]
MFKQLDTPILLVILGGALGAWTVINIQYLTFLGQPCFYSSHLNGCLNPGIYYGLLGLSGILVAIGVALIARSPKDS